MTRTDQARWCSAPLRRPSEPSAEDGRRGPHRPEASRGLAEGTEERVSPLVGGARRVGFPELRPWHTL